MKHILDILLTKFKTTKLTKLGLPVRERDNNYTVHSFVARLLTADLMSLEDLRDLETKSLLLEKLGSHYAAPEAAELFKQYLHTFDDQEKEVMQNQIYNFSDVVQDYVLTQVLSEKNIDKLANKSQDYMWTGVQFVKTLRMLHRNGLMGFSKAFKWQRRINPSNLSREEVEYYATFGRVDFSEYGGHNSMAKYERHIEAFAKWEGFVETVPAEFLVVRKYRDGKYVSMVDLMSEHGLPADLMEIAVKRHGAQAKAVAGKEAADKKAKEDQENKEYAHITELFAKQGIKVDKPANEKWNGSDRYTVETMVEDVPHTMYVMKMGWYNKKTYTKQVREESNDHFEMLQKYKETIRAEFKRLKLRGCTHVMEGGGGQMQAFFSDNNGYMCIMYLGMKGSMPVKKWTSHWQRHEAGKDPFGPETYYEGATAEADIARNK